MTPFISWDDGTPDGDLGCEIRGHIDEDGVIYVEEVTFYKEPQS